MIKKIYQISDVHIPTYKGLAGEYAEQIAKLIESIESDFKVSKITKDEARIVICGDLVNSKNNVTNELNVFVSSFIRQLSSIAKVYCIAGNHDLIESNTSRTDTLTAIFHTAKFKNAIFIDEKLDYKSGVLFDDNIIWALYSFYDNFNKPDIDYLKDEHKDSTIFGLYHGQIIGTKLYNGIVNDSGQDSTLFEGCDYVLAGHIHKRQVIKKNQCEIIYAGSLIQQNYGETVNEHGYVIWNYENNKWSYCFIDIPNDYGYYDFTVQSIDDIKNDKEKINNL